MRHFIPKYMGGKRIVKILNILAVLFPVPGKVIRQNRKHNENIWKKPEKLFWENGYIVAQSELKEFCFGKKNQVLDRFVLNNKPLNGAKNTCEVIAVYNAWNALTQNKETECFPALLSWFEHKGAVLWGYFGTSPTAALTFFNEKGYSCDILYEKEMTERTLDRFARQYQVFLLTSFNDANDLMQQIHTMCVVKTKKAFQMYNDYMGNRRYPSLYAAVYGYRAPKAVSRPICLIGISSET